MAVTHAEFLRLLPAAAGNLDYRVTDNTVVISHGPGTITIELDDESRKSIASLSLPLTRLSIAFDNLTDHDAGLFLKHFNLVYQKGGG